jgi:Prp8 binding protein
MSAMQEDLPLVNVAQDRQLSVVSGAAPTVPQVQVAGFKRTSSLHAPIMQLSGHQGTVYATRFSPDGAVLASASFDKSVCLWRVHGVECENFGVLKGHKNAVLDVAFCAAGASLLSVSADMAVVLWDLETGARVRRVAEHRAVINACAASGGPVAAELLASVSDDCSAKLWDTRQRASALSVAHRYPLTAVAFANAGHSLLLSGVDGVIRMHDLRKEAAAVFELLGHDDLVCGLAVNPLGTHVLSNSFDCTLREWDIRPYCATPSRCTLTYMGHGASSDKNLMRCSWSADGQRVAAGSGDKFVYVWSRDTQKILYKLPGHRGCVNDVQFSPNEPIIASCSNDRTIFLGELQLDD